MRKTYFIPYKSYLLCVLYALLLVINTGCTDEHDEPLKVGFIGCLSGKCSDLGTDGLNGALLAVEEINSVGGIIDSGSNRKQIELVTANDQGHPEVARKVFVDLIQSGVKAVIGPMTSQIGVTLQPLAETYKTVMVSPTVSTTQLSRTDDYFFRIYPTSDVTAPALAEYAMAVDKAFSFVVAYDETNKAFTDSWINNFRDSVAEKGGEITGLQPLHATLPMLDYAKRINALKPDALLVIANAFNTGLLIQQLHKLESDIRIMGTEWSTTKSLPEYSGRALNNAFFISSFDETRQKGRHQDFIDSYATRFNSEASFAAKFGYEAMQILLAAIARAPDEDNIKDALKELGPVEGLQVTLEFDQFGDIKRDVYIKTFRDNHFTTTAKASGKKVELIQTPDIKTE